MRRDRKVMAFLVNPSGTRARPVQTKANGKDSTNAKRRKARRRKRSTSTAPTTTGAAGGGSMARKASRRRKRGANGRFQRNAPATATVANPPRRRRRRTTSARRTTTARRYRRNPPRGGLLGDLVPFASDAAMGAVGVLGGKILARKVRSLAKQGPGTLLGSLVEAATGVVGGLLVSNVSPAWGERIAVGGLLAPMETLVQQLGIRGISDTLGDDGFIVGGDSGVDLVSAYDDGDSLAAGDLAGYLPTDDGNSQGGTLAGYVYGAAA